MDVGTSYPPRADEHRPAPERREIMFHLNIIKLPVHIRKFIQERQQGRDVPLAVAKIGESFSKRLVGSDLKSTIERLACGFDVELGIENQQLLSHGMEEAFGLVIMFCSGHLYSLNWLMGSLG